MTQHGGKELSYLNLFDTEAAWRLVHRFDEPACVIVKHANPCGVAVADRHHRRPTCGRTPAIRSARSAASSPLNRPVPPTCAEALAPVFTEVVVAPATTTTRSTSWPPRRTCGCCRPPPRRRCRSTSARSTAACSSSSPTRSRTDRRRGGWSPSAQPTDAQWDDLEFAWLVCAAVSSQRHRLRQGPPGVRHRCRPAEPASTRPASPPSRAGGRADGGACASDAFFPFRDGLDAAAAAGITAVIQPGGPSATTR